MESQKFDNLAQQLIAHYWHQLRRGRTWNYHDWPPKYVSSDQWSTEKQWIDYALECRDSGQYLLTAYDILLNAGHLEYLPEARKIVEQWHVESGHDPEYYWNIISYLDKDDPLHQEYLGYTHPGELENEAIADMGWVPGGHTERSVLVGTNDPVLCEYMAIRVSDTLNSGDLAKIEGFAMPRLLELGPRCGDYINPQVMQLARSFCSMMILKDEQACCSNDNSTDSGERSWWIRHDIALIAWRLGWIDLLEDLNKQDWYWDTLFDSGGDADNMNLLVWSLFTSNDILLNRAKLVMQYDQNTKIDGAIAWIRLRAGSEQCDVES